MIDPRLTDTTARAESPSVTTAVWWYCEKYFFTMRKFIVEEEDLVC